MPVNNNDQKKKNKKKEESFEIVLKKTPDGYHSNDKSKSETGNFYS